MVFGSNKCLWGLPVSLKSGKPIGNGVEWLNSATSLAGRAKREVEVTKRIQESLSEGDSSKTIETISSPKY